MNGDGHVLNGPASTDGIKLGQQLFTTMSTLVVAISAFYLDAVAAMTQDRLVRCGEFGVSFIPSAISMYGG